MRPSERYPTEVLSEFSLMAILDELENEDDDDDEGKESMLMLFFMATQDDEDISR